MTDDTARKRLTGTERKELIIQNTIDLVSEKGFKSVTTKDIANRCQVNEALIFQHFTTKQGLMNAVVNDILNRRTAFIGEMTTPSTEEEFIEKLNLYEDYFLSHNLGNPAYLKIILYYILEQYPDLPEAGRQIDETFQNWLHDAIEKGKREWRYRKDIDTEIAVSFFIGGFIYYILKKALMEETQLCKDNHAEHQFVKIFIHSLCDHSKADKRTMK